MGEKKGVQPRSIQQTIRNAATKTSTLRMLTSQSSAYFENLYTPAIEVPNPSIIGRSKDSWGKQKAIDCSWHHHHALGSQSSPWRPAKTVFLAQRHLFYMNNSDWKA